MLITGKQKKRFDKVIHLCSCAPTISEKNKRRRVSSTSMTSMRGIPNDKRSSPPPPPCRDELQSSQRHGFCPLRQSDEPEIRMYLICRCPTGADSIQSVSRSLCRTASNPIVTEHFYYSSCTRKTPIDDLSLSFYFIFLFFLGQVELEPPVQSNLRGRPGGGP